MKNVFLNADCMNYLPLYPDGYFDLAIVDPPYGISIGHKQTGGRISVRGEGDYAFGGKKNAIQMIGGGTFRDNHRSVYRGAQEARCATKILSRVQRQLPAGRAIL